MSWVLDTRPRNARPGLIGPGRLVLVVGPSGAGKDTLLDGARAACRDDAGIVFPRRVITRPSSPSEDNDTVAAADFNQAAADGAFALWWEAHGNGYGISSSIDDDIGHGRTVVCNVSRTIITAARLRYSQVAVVLVTAPPKVLKARLEARGRASDGAIDQRVKRSEEMRPCEADFVIRNTGWREVGVFRLVNVIRDCGFYVIY
jgi:ribose 1,5-bisphosphokinase